MKVDVRNEDVKTKTKMDLLIVVEIGF